MARSGGGDGTSGAVSAHGMAVTPMFETARFRVRELHAHELPLLQALFERHPEFFFTVNGRAPEPDEARQEFDELPPQHLSYSRRWFGGVFDRDGALQGNAVVVSDLAVARTWHVVMYLLATPLHGTGAATEVFAALEAWVRAQGARWLRLGVVVGNTRAERFWERCGFVEVRRRDNMDTGGRINTLRVMVKPLADGTVDEYLQQAPRDRPGSPLP